MRPDVSQIGRSGSAARAARTKRPTVRAERRATASCAGTSSGADGRRPTDDRAALRRCTQQGPREALRGRNLPPALDAVEAAFKAHADAFDEVRHEGLTREMTSEAAERFFALGFALEQMREHLSEVHRVVGEWASD